MHASVDYSEFISEFRNKSSHDLLSICMCQSEHVDVAMFHNLFNCETLNSYMMKNESQLVVTMAHGYSLSNKIIIFYGYENNIL